MFISTGLEPIVRLQRVPKMTSGITFGHTPGSFPVPLGASEVGEVWVVELRTAKDTKECPKGTIQEILILGREPRVEKRGVRLTIPNEDVRADAESRRYESARREHRFPDDAVVETDWVGIFHMKETTISWYELEV